MRRFMKRRSLIPTAVMLSLVAVGCGGPSGRAQGPKDDLTVATWNLEWFFDEYQGDNYSRLAKEQSAPDRHQWEWKRNGVAAAIAELRPDILALQEVENQRVLFYLQQRLKSEHHLNYKIAFVGGTDYFTEQDVALLYQDGLVEYGRHEISAAMRDSKEYYSVAKHLFARFQWGTGASSRSLWLVTAHLRAMEKGDGIRRRQARSLRRWIDEMRQREENVIVLGDLNTEQPVERPEPTSEMGILLGLATPDTDDDLIDLHSRIPSAARQTHLLTGKRFDRVLVSQSLMKDEPGKKDLVFRAARVRSDVVIRGQHQDTDHWNKYYKIPERERDLSDHYPVVAVFSIK